MDDDREKDVKVLVMGAGLAGVLSAWYLRAQGMEVTVIGRQLAAAVEQRAGSPSVSYSPGRLFFRRSGSDIRPLVGWQQQGFRSAVGNLLGQGCRAAREQGLLLAAYGRDCLDELYQEAGLVDASYQLPGRLRLIRSARQYSEAVRDLEMLRRHGSSGQLLVRNQVFQLEPALLGMCGPLMGALYQAGCSAVDSYTLLVRLMELARARGVAFRFESGVVSLESGEDLVHGVRINGQLERADYYLVTQGVDARCLLAGVGIRVPLYPLNGYSLMVKPRKSIAVPRMLVQDAGTGVVVGALDKSGVRISSAPEWASVVWKSSRRRALALEKAASRLLPGVADSASGILQVEVQHAMPDGLPLLGRTAYTNLFLNLGHAGEDSVLMCGAAHYLAELVGGGVPKVAFSGLDLFRQPG